MCSFGFLTNVGMWRSLLSQWNCRRRQSLSCFCWWCCWGIQAGAYTSLCWLPFLSHEYHCHLGKMTVLMMLLYTVPFSICAWVCLLGPAERRNSLCWVFLFLFGWERKEEYQATQDNSYSSQTWRDFLLHPLDVAGDCSFVSWPARPK